MKLVLCLLAGFSAFQATAQTRTATVSAYCRSLSLYPATAYSSGNPYTLGFTTPDSTSALPLYVMLPGGKILTSSEVRPVAGPLGIYQTDYFLLLNAGLQQHGTVGLSIPSGDADHNGIPDLIELGKSFYGSGTNSALETATNAFQLRFNRSSGSLTGAYSGMLTRPNGNYVFNGRLGISLLQGKATYLRQRQNQLQLELTRIGDENLNLLLTNSAICISNSMSGSVIYTVSSPGVISLPQFVLTNILQVVNQRESYSTNFDGGPYGTNAVTLTNSFNETNSFTLGLYTALPARLKLSGNRYVGNLQLVDGSLATPWADYRDWVMEIQDPNDTDGNGTPDLSDPSMVAIPTSRFSLAINGDGTVSPNLNGRNLAIGKTYKLTANPATGRLFSSWTGSIVASTRTLSFVMQSNLVLQANFVPNLFYPVRGTYRGLISSTNGPAQQTAGYITAITTDKAHYSAKVQLGGRSYSFSGAFDAAGQATQSVWRTDGSTLFLQLQLDLNGANLLLGTVRDGTWTASITAKKSPFNAAQVPCPFAGRYTLSIAPQYLVAAPPSDTNAPPGTDSETSTAVGYGYGTVTVDANGRVKLTGSLADGSPIAQTTALSAEGEWPLYLGLYHGRGYLQSLLTLTNQAASPTAGTLTWLKLFSLTEKYYPAGFTNRASLTLAPYHPPGAGAAVLNWTNGSIVFSGANLPQYFANEVLLRSENSKFANASTNKLTLTLARSSGLFKGSVIRPDTAQRISFKGVLLQPMMGCGYFLGNNLSGQVTLGQSGVPGQFSTNPPVALNNALPAAPLW